MKKHVQHYYKYNQLINALRQQIFSGEFSCGSQLPPERKLAEMFGVSRITIRTALTELKNDGLIEQLPGVGTYVKGQKSEKVAEQKQFRFCVFFNASPMGVEPESDPYNSQLLLGIHKFRSSENNFMLDLRVYSREDSLAAGWSREPDELRQWDGIIIACSHTEEDIEYLLKNRINFVVVGESGSMRFFPIVTTDNFQGSYMLTNHLLEHGVRKPVFLFGSRNYLWEQRRRAGFRQALLDAGLPCSEDNFYGDGYPDLEKTQALVQDLLKDKARSFDALILPWDVEVIGVMNALKAAKLRVPEDVVVAVFDNYQWLVNMYPGLPALLQPFSRLGEAAVELLTAKIRQPEITVVKAIPPQLLPGDLQ